jgi:class 3 adenylate cyclase
MDIGGWLRRLGLEEYEAAFRDNKIDDTVLPNLTAEDLKDLGVGAVGHRRKLLDAITALRAEASTQAALTVAPLESDKAAQDTAERRQVTVMFSDLVGSTALSARMDPEDLREVISAYQRCVADTVRRFGGFVAKYMGDGVLIYFGYPAAHEDDAERAVRAGLALIDAVAALPTPEPLQLRIGAATGMVVVGDLVTGPVKRRSAVLSARRRTWPHACKASPSRTRSLLPRPRASCSVICSSCGTLDQRSSRGSPVRCERSRRCGQVLSKAGSRQCTPAA